MKARPSGKGPEKTTPPLKPHTGQKEQSDPTKISGCLAAHALSFLLRLSNILFKFFAFFFGPHVVVELRQKTTKKTLTEISTEIMNKQAMFDQEKLVFWIAFGAESSYENFPDRLLICVKGE